MVNVGETRRRFENRLKEHARMVGDRTTNSLYAKHLVEMSHKFINSIINLEILKVIDI